MTTKNPPFNFLEEIDKYFVKYLAFYNYRKYSNRLTLQNNEKVLEVGSGIGNLSRFVVKRIPKGHLSCLEILEKDIRKAEKSLKTKKNIEFVKKDILNFERSNYFDSIIINYVLHDVANKEQFVQKVKMCLKPKGKIFVREPTRQNHGMATKEINKLMKRNGFLEIKSKEGKSFPLKGKVYEGIWQS